MPVDRGQPARVVELSFADIRPFIYGRVTAGDSAASLIPNANAFVRSRSVARCDGLFVMEIGVSSSGGLNPNDLDELAYVVSMVTKTKLEHTHYHHNMPGKGKASVLKPSQILLVPPVQILATGWSGRIERREFADEHARAAKTARVPGTEQGLQALPELRQRFIRLEDTMSFRIRAHRTTQATRVRSFGGRLSFVVFGLFAAIAIFLLLLPPPHRFGLRDGVSVALTAVGISMALYFRGRISRWDVPVIRLLRTAHGFFTSADPLNKVIEAIKIDGRSKAPVDHFHVLIANISSRLEGEQHRVAMGQNWLALSLVAASLVAAISALKYSDQELASSAHKDKRAVATSKSASTPPRGPVSTVAPPPAALPPIAGPASSPGGSDPAKPAVFGAKPAPGKKADAAVIAPGAASNLNLPAADAPRAH